MSDETDKIDEAIEQPQQNVGLPPQSSAADTSNWDDREFTTPTGRIVIETNQTEDPDTVVVAE